MIAILVGQSAGQSSPSPFGGNFIFMMVIIVAAFYFIILRPQKKEQKRREQLIGGMKKGDKVVSAGGIHGTVVDASRKDTVVVEVDPKRSARLTFNRGSISVINPEKTDADPKDAGGSGSESSKAGK